MPRFPSHVDKSQMDEDFRLHDFLRQLAVCFLDLAKRRRHEAVEIPVAFAIAARVSSRFFLWAAIFSCRSNRQVDSLREPVVMCFRAICVLSFVASWCLRVRSTDSNTRSREPTGGKHFPFLAGGRPAKAVPYCFFGSPPRKSKIKITPAIPTWRCCPMAGSENMRSGVIWSKIPASENGTMR